MRAATLERRAALEAFTRWQADADPDGPDAPYRRYFPLVWHNLGPDLQDEPLSEALADEYWRTWAHNQFLHQRAAVALDVLHAAHVPTLALKGAALNALYYRDLGARPMLDVDILVPYHRLPDADRALRHGGWQPDDPKYLATTCALQAASFHHETEGGQLDLHWRPLYIPTRETDLWTNAVPIAIGGVATHAPYPADQLLHVCADGISVEWVHGIRWIPDALAVLRHPIDWDRFVYRAGRHRLTTPARAALALLASLFDAPIPNLVLEQLNALPRTRLDEWTHRHATGCRSLLGHILLDVNRYTRTRRLGFDGRTVSLPRYVRHTHRIDAWLPYLWQTARHAIPRTPTPISRRAPRARHGHPPD